MKLTIHPLFLAVGLLSAVFGGLPTFFICVLTALLHECGHIFCAARYGFECSKISLMPYGAAATCDVEGISPKDEIMLALSGPAVNLLIVIAVAGLWWFYPETYPFTDVIFYANAGMLALNLLPAYPLDGGRIAKCVLGGFMKGRTADVALRAVNIVVVGLLIAAYFFLYRNITLFTVAALLFFSAFMKKPPAGKINFLAKKRKRGREIKFVILDENATFRDALKFIDGSKFSVFQIYGDKFLDEITEDELCEKLMSRSLYDKILSL